MELSKINFLTYIFAFLIGFVHNNQFSTPLGYITTYAGSSCGYSGDGGKATSAKLNTPLAGYIETNNIFIADSSNNKIRKIDRSTTIITTYAGNGSSSNTGDGGQATSATTQLPRYVTADSSYLYISIRLLCAIRRVDRTTGIIDTVVGNGQCSYNGDGLKGTSTSINVPVGIFLNTYMWFCDQSNNRIRRVLISTGTVTNYIGNGTLGSSGDNGNALLATIYAPTWVYVDASYVWIVDKANHCIRRVSLTTQTITSFAGICGYANPTYGGDGGLATSAFLNNPVGSHFTVSYLFFSDIGNYRIRKIFLSTNIITTIAGDGQGLSYGDGGPATLAAVNQPYSIFGDEYNIWSNDQISCTVRRINIGRPPSILGDPHFVGLRGGSYTIDLLADKCYNIFRSSLIMWNSCAVQHSHHSSIYLKTTSFRINQEKIYLDLSKAGNYYIITNGGTYLPPVNKKSIHISISKAVHIFIYHRYILLKMPCFHLMIQPQLKKKCRQLSNGSKYINVFGYFNFRVIDVMLSDMGCQNADGILGITWNKTAIPTGRKGEGILQDISKYEVPPEHPHS